MLPFTVRDGKVRVTLVGDDEQVRGFLENREVNYKVVSLTDAKFSLNSPVKDEDGSDLIEVLPVGCDTDVFVPRSPRDPQVRAVREALGVAPDELMLLTVGGDAASSPAFPGAGANE
jgi:hypothetical protein